MIAELEHASGFGVSFVGRRHAEQCEDSGGFGRALICRRGPAYRRWSRSGGADELTFQLARNSNYSPMVL